MSGTEFCSLIKSRGAYPEIDRRLSTDPWLARGSFRLHQRFASAAALASQKVKTPLLYCPSACAFAHIIAKMFKLGRKNNKAATLANGQSDVSPTNSIEDQDQDPRTFSEKKQKSRRPASMRETLSVKALPVLF